MHPTNASKRERCDYSCNEQFASMYGWEKEMSRISTHAHKTQTNVNKKAKERRVLEGLKVGDISLPISSIWAYQMTKHPHTKCRDKAVNQWMENRKYKYAYKQFAGNSHIVKSYNFPKLKATVSWSEHSEERPSAYH
jgi:hypothetical protein